MQWQARRAHGAWFQVVLDSLGKIHDMRTLQRINITVNYEPSDSDYNLTLLEPVDPPEWFSDEKQRLNDAFLVAIEIAADRSWNQMLFGTCLPSTFAGVLLDDDSVKVQRHLKFIHTVWDAVLKAEALVVTTANKSIRDFMKSLLSDLAWNQMQICRELYVLCCQCQWSMDGTSPSGDHIRTLAMYLHGSPCNTKFDLEDLFAHLVSVGKLTTLATAMNKLLCLNEISFQLKRF